MGKRFAMIVLAASAPLLSTAEDALSAGRATLSGGTQTGMNVAHPHGIPSTLVDEAMSQPTSDSLRAALEAAAAGLTYMSESDYPFEFFFLPGAGDRPPGVDAFAERVGAAADAPRQERDLDRFFARHVEKSDPADAESQRLRPRYEALREVLRGLQGVTVYRIGAVEVDCYIVGGDGNGNLAGLRTVAVET